VFLIPEEASEKNTYSQFKTMSDIPQVSIIIPVFNGQDTIQDCIDSLLNLNYPAEDREIILVDNGSTDRTPGILAEYGDLIQCYQERKRGAAAARNCGIKNCQGEWAVFTDADCVVGPQWLLKLVPHFTDPSVGIVGGKILAKKPANKVELFGERIHDQQKAINEFSPPYAISMNWASPRQLLLEMGGFDTTLLRGQDLDLSYRIGKKGFSLVYEPESIVYHRNEDSLIGLFQEGATHGFYNHLIYKKHQTYIEAFSEMKLQKAHQRLLKSFKNVLVPKEDRYNEFCLFVYTLGSVYGKMKREFHFRIKANNPAHQ
jgi:glycosyltransferase involved in cell wall biosynthesis